MKHFFHWFFKSKIYRFLISGGITSVAVLALLYVFTEIAGLWYLFSSLLALGVGVVVNFVLQKFWAFQEKKLDTAAKQFLRYCILVVVYIALNSALLFFFVDILGVWYLLSQVIVIAILTVVSFLGYSIIFSRKNEKGQKKKVLIATGLYPPDIGGPATYSKILEGELPHSGFDVSVVTFGAVRGMPKIVRHVAYFLMLVEEGLSCDIVYAQDPVSVGLPALFAAKLLRKKLLLKVVGDYAWEQYCQRSTASLKFPISNFQFPTIEEFQGRKFDWMTEARRMAEQFVARRAERVVVPSKYLKGIVMQWGVPHGKIEMIYNAFEPPEIMKSKDELRQELGLSGTVLISVGRLVPWKGFGTLIELMPEIHREMADARLYIVGEGPERETFELRIKSYELRDVVVLTGKLEYRALLKYLKAANVFVLNTAYEGFSHLLLEVMAVGTPIVTTNVGGNPELIENGKTGVLVTVNNKKELKNAILKFLRTPERNDVAKNAREKVKEFNQEKMTHSTAQLLKSVCES